MHLNLEMKNMTLSSKVTNLKTSFLGNNDEKENLIEFEWHGFNNLNQCVIFKKT